jgi:hypothetical protein
MHKNLDIPTGDSCEFMPLHRVSEPYFIQQGPVKTEMCALGRVSCVINTGEEWNMPTEPCEWAVLQTTGERWNMSTEPCEWVVL